MLQFRIWDLHGQQCLPVRAELPPLAVRSWDEAKWVRQGFEVREKWGMALQPGVRSGKGARSRAGKESLMGSLQKQQEQDPEEADEGGIGPNEIIQVPWLQLLLSSRIRLMSRDVACGEGSEHPHPTAAFPASRRAREAAGAAW